MTDSSQAPTPKDWRGRSISGILMTTDPRVMLFTGNLSIFHWLRLSEIEFFERVEGANSRAHGFSMLVDDEGHRKRLPWNPRAQFLSGYPIESPILGNVIFWSVAMTPDGQDFIDLTPEANSWLTADARRTEYSNWLNQNAEYARAYMKQFPTPGGQPQH